MQHCTAPPFPSVHVPATLPACRPPCPFNNTNNNHNTSPPLYDPPTHTPQPPPSTHLSEGAILASTFGGLGATGCDSDSDGDADLLDARLDEPEGVPGPAPRPWIDDSASTFVGAVNPSPSAPPPPGSSDSADAGGEDPEGGGGVDPDPDPGLSAPDPDPDPGGAGRWSAAAGGASSVTE